jgi:hypothetical protein
MELAANKLKWPSPFILIHLNSWYIILQNLVYMMLTRFSEKLKASLCNSAPTRHSVQDIASHTKQRMYDLITPTIAM